MKDVRVVEVHKYDSDFPPEDAVGAMAWFEAKLAQIPPEHMARARIEFDTYHSYGDTYASIDIYYTRPATAAEAAAETAERHLRDQNKKQQELRQLAELLAKHGPPA